MTRRPSTPSKRPAICDHRVAHGRPALGVDRGDGFVDRLPVLRRPGHRPQLSRERRHQHVVLRPQVRREACRPPRARTPCSATCSGCCRRAARRWSGMVSCATMSGVCRTPSSSRMNSGAVRPRDHAAVLVVHPGLDQHAGDLGQLGDDEGLEDDPVAADVRLRCLRPRRRFRAAGTDCRRSIRPRTAGRRSRSRGARRPPRSARRSPIGPDEARTCPTMRTVPGSPMRPSGEVILTDTRRTDCDWTATHDSRIASTHGDSHGAAPRPRAFPRRRHVAAIDVPSGLHSARAPSSRRQARAASSAFRRTPSASPGRPRSSCRTRPEQLIVRARGPGPGTRPAPSACSISAPGWHPRSGILRGRKYSTSSRSTSASIECDADAARSSSGRSA